MKKNAHLGSGQRGFTLVSLMVGLVISMLVILAMLSLFRVVLHFTFDQSSGMQPTAAQDRQATTGLLTVQNQLQSAGFGIASAASNTNFAVVSGAALASTNKVTGTAVTLPTTATTYANAIFWESNPTQTTATTAWTCQGLISSSADNSVSLLQAAGSCNPVSTQWSSKVWTVTPLIGANILPAINAAPPVPPNLTFQASTGTGACWPYGAEVNTASLPASAASAVSGLTSSQTHTAGLSIRINWTTNSGSNSWTTCLPNFST